MKLAAALVLLAGCAGGLYAAEADPSAQYSFAAAIARLEQDKPAEAVDILVPLAAADDVRAQFLLAVLLDIGAGAAIDHERAEELLVSAGSRDFAAAAHYLAWKHRVGFGIGDDPAGARHWQEVAARLPIGVLPVPGSWLRMRDTDFSPGFRRAFLWMAEAAERREPAAMSNLAAVYLATQWVAPDPSLHLHWLILAADAGDGKAAERLAMYYRRGLFVAPDEDKASHYLRQAAEAGLVEAQHSLAEILVSSDPERAIPWYRRAIEQGDTGAMIDLGRLFRDGEVVPRDYEAAIELFRRAVALGSHTAMGDLGWMYEHGRGVPQDLDAAAESYKEGAAGGNAWAANALGHLYSLDGYPGRDRARAIEAYKRAADLGSADAMMSLGAIYFEGTGVAKDESEAFLWYERAARKGHAGAQNRIGWLLRNGYGIDKDPEEAVHWFHLAADKGFAWSHANLGYHYGRGLGVDRDFPAALEHLAQALRSLEDDWLNDTFQGLFRHAPERDHPVLQSALISLAEATSIEPASPLFRQVTQLLLDGPGFVRDRSLGAQRLEFAASHGEAWALSEMGRRCYFGHAFPLDTSAAIGYVTRAANAGDSQGGRLLALFHLFGGNATEKRMAAETLAALAEAGDGAAAWELATACATGIGLPEDFDRAWRFVEQAARNGFPPARNVVANYGEERQMALRRYFGASIFDPDLSRLYDAAEKETARRPANVPPSVLQRIAPNYPRQLLHSGVDGEVVAVINVSAHGRPTNIVIESATHPLFAGAAEASIRKWWFAPGKKDGAPVAHQVRQTLSFKAPQIIATSSDPMTP